MHACYSDTPLLRKLGIKAEMKVLLIEEPAEYYKWLEADISSQLCKKDDIADFIHLFVKTNKEFESAMKKIKRNMKPTTIIWVSWYKKSARIYTDLTEDVIRNYALKNDLVDVKVCAVSEVWSGLKLVVPLVKR
jgi:hypothetical protein